MCEASPHPAPWKAFLVLILLLPSIPSEGSDDPPYEERIPSEESMEEVREEGAYDYSDPEEENVGERSFLSRIRTFLEDYFYSPVESAIDSGPFLRYALLILGIAGILFFFWKNGALSVFRGEAVKKGRDPVPISSLDMQEESPLRKAREAEQENALVDALRWRYIHIVQGLGRKRLIRKGHHRTDREFLSDLKGTGLEDAFGELSRFFQMIRYGERPLRERDYEEWKERFKDLERRIERHEG